MRARENPFAGTLHECILTVDSPYLFNQLATNALGPTAQAIEGWSSSPCDGGGPGRVARTPRGPLSRDRARKRWSQVSGALAVQPSLETNNGRARAGGTQPAYALSTSRQEKSGLPQDRSTQYKTTKHDLRLQPGWGLRTHCRPIYWGISPNPPSRTSSWATRTRL